MLRACFSLIIQIMEGPADSAQTTSLQREYFSSSDLRTSQSIVHTCVLAASGRASSFLLRILNPRNGFRSFLLRYLHLSLVFFLPHLFFPLHCTVHFLIIHITRSLFYLSLSTSQISFIQHSSSLKSRALQTDHNISIQIQTQSSCQPPTCREGTAGH